MMSIEGGFKRNDTIRSGILTKDTSRSGVLKDTGMHVWSELDTQERS